MSNLHVPRLPALRWNNGAAPTWLRRGLIGLALSASAAVAWAAPGGRLTAIPAEKPGSAPATIGKAIPLGGGTFLYVPPGAPAGKPLPLLLLFPGTGGDGRGFVWGMKPLADRAKFALLGFSPGSGNFHTVDNFFDDLEAGRAHAKLTWPQPRFGKDVDAVDRALKQVFATVPIDRRQIGLFGFSHGASYALTLGTANPDLFSTIAALSPGILVINADVKGGQSIFLGHGRSDQVQPYRRTACAMVPRLSELGYTVEFAGFKGGHELPPELVVEAVKHFLGERGPGETPKCPER